MTAEINSSATFPRMSASLSAPRVDGLDADDHRAVRDAGADALRDSDGGCLGRRRGRRRGGDGCDGGASDRRCCHRTAYRRRRLGRGEYCGLRWRAGCDPARGLGERRAGHAGPIGQPQLRRSGSCRPRRSATDLRKWSSGSSGRRLATDGRRRVHCRRGRGGSERGKGRWCGKCCWCSCRPGRHSHRRRFGSGQESGRDRLGCRAEPW